MEFINELVPFAKNHPILTLAWLSLFIAIIYLTIKTKFSKVKAISNAETVNLINTKEAIIIDTRANDSYKRGHIITAYNILPSDIKNGSIKTIEKFKAKPVVVVCENGITAPGSSDTLVKAGFMDVYYLKDGITGWSGENLPLIKK